MNMPVDYRLLNGLIDQPFELPVDGIIVIQTGLGGKKPGYSYQSNFIDYIYYLVYYE